MLTIPLPLLAPLILLYLAVRQWFRDGRLPAPTWLLLALAGQGVIVALVQHYGFTTLRAVQPVTASLIPPLSWLTFVAVNRRALTPAQDWPHLLGPAFFLFCVATAPQWVDAALVLQFVAYGLVMLWLSRDGADSLPHANLGAGDLPLHAWRLLAVSLILSGLADMAIALAFMLHMPELKFYVLDTVSALTLLLIGLLCMPLSPADAADPEDEPARTDSIDPDPAFDAALVTRLEQLLVQSGLFREPGLTLGRLAKRLNVPAKQLSGAINRQSGESVSRYVNGYRIRDAVRRIEDGQPITTAMLDSGFNTKSNFNREFLRVMGTSPSAWRERQRLPK